MTAKHSTIYSPGLQKKVYADYLQRNWVTGQSSPWMDGFTVKPGDNTAEITYTYMTSDGFAGYYRQRLTLVTENGWPMISAYTEPKQFFCISTQFEFQGQKSDQNEHL